MTWSLSVGLFAAAIGIVYAIGCAVWVLNQLEGSPALQVPYLAIREGASAFIRTQYGVIALAGLAIFLLFYGWLLILVS